MMILEHNKVYKITHERNIVNWPWARDYIICSPIIDVHIEDDFFEGPHTSIAIDSHFIVCFDGHIKVEELKNITSLYYTCTVEEITTQDYQDIRNAIQVYNAKPYNIKNKNKILYNRKKNFITFK